MLPSLAAKAAKANKHNDKLKSNKHYAKKVNEKLAVTAYTGGFDAHFKTIEEKEQWLQKREEAKWGSVSW